MKTILKNNDIWALFYQRKDDIVVRTKHCRKYSNSPALELRNGVLYENGQVKGLCNHKVPFVILLRDTYEYLNYKYCQDNSFNNPIYNLPADAIRFNVSNNISDIKCVLWRGVNYILIVVRHINELNAYNSKFANCEYFRNKYYEARKLWLQARKDILDIKEGDNNLDIWIHDRYWWGYYSGYKKFLNNVIKVQKYDENYKDKLSRKETIAISGKIIYYNNCVKNDWMKKDFPTYRNFEDKWSTANGRKEIKALAKKRKEEYEYISKAYQEKLAIQNSVYVYKQLNDFRDYKIPYIRYDLRQYTEYDLGRFAITRDKIEFSNGYNVSKERFLEFAQAFTDAVMNNIQLTENTYRRVIIVAGDWKIFSLTANDMWNIHWGPIHLTYMELGNILRNMGVSIKFNRMSRRRYIAKYRMEF